MGVRATHAPPAASRLFETPFRHAHYHDSRISDSLAEFLSDSPGSFIVFLVQTASTHTKCFLCFKSLSYYTTALLRHNYTRFANRMHRFSASSPWLPIFANTALHHTVMPVVLTLMNTSHVAPEHYGAPHGCPPQHAHRLRASHKRRTALSAQTITSFVCAAPTPNPGVCTGLRHGTGISIRTPSPRPSCMRGAVWG